MLRPYVMVRHEYGAHRGERAVDVCRLELVVSE